MSICPETFTIPAPPVVEKVLAPPVTIHCVLPAGHEGPHQTRLGHAWTHEGMRAYVEQQQAFIRGEAP